MWNVTKMLTEQWCQAVEQDGYSGPLVRLALRGQLPSGVNETDPRVVEDLRRCRADRDLRLMQVREAIGNRAA